MMLYVAANAGAFYSAVMLLKAKYACFAYGVEMQLS